MPKQTETIRTILGGMSPSQHFFGEGQYSYSIGIDPDLPQSDAVGDRQTSGIIRPSGYAKFSSTNISANPVAIITTPKTSLIYVVGADGKLVSYTSAFGSETLIGTVTGSVAAGAFYYNNYIYITGTGASANDVSRYGPLDGAASLTNGVWTGATLGSLTALGTATYPSLRGGGNYPKHWGHVHTNDTAYFCDYDNSTSTAATRGRGFLNAIKTTFSATEGTGNNGSAYNVLDLPLGFLPTDIESYGTDIVVCAVQTSDSTLDQGRACLFFWDTFSDSFYNQVWLPDSLATALYNNNGILYIFSGAVSNGADSSNGYRVSVYSGGQSTRQVYYSNYGSPPTAGAVAAIGDKVFWGSFAQIPTTTASAPEYFATVTSIGSKDQRLPSGVHGAIRATATTSTSDGLVTAIAPVQQSSFAYPKLAVGWRGASSTFGIDSQSTTYGTSVWRSQIFSYPKNFIVRRITMMLGATPASNMTITPTIFYDDFSGSVALTTINSTNFTTRKVELYQTGANEVYGQENFCLELRFSGTSLLPVDGPIEIEVDLIDD